MFEALLYAVVLVALARIWSRMAGFERRLLEVETGAGFGMAEAPAPSPHSGEWERTWVEAEASPEQPAPPAPVEPEPESEPSPVAEPQRPSPTWEDLLPGAADVGEDPEPAGSGMGFEELFGRRLPIWAGGVTLAVAGVLIVRYSIEAGLLSPLVRVLSGLSFGGALIAAAEAALRAEARLRDPRVAQALAGAGIASLYASILVAVNLYGLIGPLTGFLGMAAVTALALTLSLRFGAPSALLGLVGGLAAPALVGAGEPDVPLLTLYLALAVGGLCLLSRTQRWVWLGAGALAGGFGWGAMLLLSGALDAASTLSVGFYILLVGMAFPLLAVPGAAGRLLRAGGGVVAVAQMAALVATGGYSSLHWGLFALISVAIVWLARRDEGLKRLPVVGLALALLLAGAWPQPTPAGFALVAIGAAAIYGGAALLALWRAGGSLVEAAQIAAVAMAAPFLALMHFYRADQSADLPLAAAMLGAALLPAGAAALGWRQEERRWDGRFALLASAAALLTAMAALLAAPLAALAPIVAGIAAALLLLSLAAEDERIEWSAWLFLAVALLLLAAPPVFNAELARLLGEQAQADALAAVLRWGAMGAATMLFAWRARSAEGRAASQAIAALLGYGAAAQLLPATLLPLAAPAAMLALAAGAGPVTPRLLPAMAALLGIALLWGAQPALGWLGAAAVSLFGEPFLATYLPAIRDTILKLLLPGLLILASVAAAGPRLRGTARAAGVAVGAAMGAVALHILFKQLFAIDTAEAFVRFALAERTLWQALLAGAGAAAAMLGLRRFAVLLCCAALAHFGLYTVLLHNPLWAEQAVGPLPLLNLLLPAYGLPLALLWAAGRYEPALAARFARPRALAQMLLIPLLAFSALRQIAEGSLLAQPGLSAEEDIARSILAVALAIGFLVWGMKREARDWRIASLVLMLAAVGKVFLLDASGLEGLMRIASFVALGVSLIGIGWLYSRSLATTRPLTHSR